MTSWIVQTTNVATSLNEGTIRFCDIDDFRRPCWLIFSAFPAV